MDDPDGFSDMDIDVSAQDLLFEEISSVEPLPEDLLLGESSIEEPLLPHESLPGSQGAETPLPRGLNGKQLVRRRLLGKQPVPVGVLALQLGLAAMVVEGGETRNEEDLDILDSRVKRTHIHYTHVQTRNSEHRQPSSFTREEFWKHIEKVYLEAYPDKTSKSGSILQFGAVAKERHKGSQKTQNGDEHHHACTSSKKQHYWSKVARISLKKYHVPLNAVAHEDYGTMWAYIRKPSRKKPLEDLDAEVYLSPAHPRGKALAEWLGNEKQKSEMRCRGRDVSETGESAQAKQGKRMRAPNMFDLIKEKGFESVDDIELFALEESEAGRTGLAEFCTKNSAKLSTLLRGARAILGARVNSIEKRVSLLDKLKRASSTLPCLCDGRWIPGAKTVLRTSGINVKTFCMAVCSALLHGAKRGRNVACVGVGGAGKSMLLEPLELIFKTMVKPQKGSTFSLGGLLDADVICFQDYKHYENTISFTDLLSIFVGETVNVRVPANAEGPGLVKHKNKAPCFISGRAPIRCTFPEEDGREEYDSMMDDRFTIFEFKKKLPLEDRDPAFPKCGRCCAAFYASCVNVVRKPASSGPTSSPSMPSSSSSSSSPSASGSASSSSATQVCEVAWERLKELVTMQKEGLLDEEEFRMAKRVCLGL
jgi:hypothetical protein